MDVPIREKESGPPTPDLPRTPEKAVLPASPETKICPVCGASNPAYAILCEGPGCGVDLGSIKPSRPTPEPEPPAAEGIPESEERPKLMLVMGNQEFECEDGDILGREGTLACQLFAGIGTVSRQHVRFNWQSQEGWMITALAHVQNITQLDGCEMSREKPQLLSGDHTLRMSTKCEVLLRVVPLQTNNP